MSCLTQFMANAVFLHSDVQSSTAIMQLQQEREEEQRQKVSIISTVLEKEYFTGEQNCVYKNCPCHICNHTENFEVQHR